MRRETLEIDGWAEVVRFEDEASGLRAIVSVHDTTLGPALGGCRMYPYPQFDDALEDVLRLSRGMTYKNALAGIPFGGGKSVIWADPKTDKSPELFHAFGEAVASLEGRYYTAADSGIHEEDLRTVQERTPYVGGVAGPDSKAGDPGPYTARGVWRGLRAAAAHKFGTEDLADRTVIVLGLGSVGAELCRLLHEDGASLIVSDIDEVKIRTLMSTYGARPAHHSEAFAKPADIYAPCALGGAINPTTIGLLQAQAVAGAANNQLATPEMGRKLLDRGVLYAPDYVINAGGVITIGMGILDEWSEDAVFHRIDETSHTVAKIFERSDREHAPTGEVADRLAEEIIEAAR